MNLSTGMKSSEWIVTLAVMGVVLLSGWLKIDTEQLWQIVVAGSGYGISRGVAKINGK